MVPVRVVVASEASFANAACLKRQPHYFVLTAVKKCRAILVSNSSCRFHRVSHAVMAAEMHTLVHAVDMAIIIKERLGKLLRNKIEKKSYVHSLTLSNVVTKTAALQSAAKTCHLSVKEELT